MTTVLVTGANGLLGQKLVALLQADAAINVIATARKPMSYAMARGRFEVMDIANAALTDAVIAAHRPAIVINTAAMTNVDQCETQREACWAANVAGVQHLIAACEKINAHLIHVSTDFIFDGSHGPLAENALPAPVNFYGESKLAGEKLIEQSKLRWAILRTVLVYGINADLSRSNIVLWVKKSLEDGKAIRVVDDQWRTPTLAEDLAMGCYLATKKKATGIFHISGSEMMTPYDIAIQTAQFFQLDTSLIERTDSTQFTQPARRPPKTGFVIDKARRELGYAPHTFQQGLAVLASQMK
jgi:dTDP-4-dehydrorhamnose reductase